MLLRWIGWNTQMKQLTKRKKKAIALIRWTTWNWFIIIISENQLLNEKLSWSFENNLYVCIISFNVQQYDSIYSVNVAFDRNQNHINTRNRLFLLAGLKQPLIQHMLLSSGTQKSCL